MDKFKFAWLMLFFLALIGLAGWGSWALFYWLGFWKSAAVIVLVEFFFAARGAHLVAGVTEVYSEEVRAFRHELSWFNKEGPLSASLAGQKTKSPGRRNWPIAFTAILLFSGMSVLFCFGFWPFVAVIFAGANALIVRMIYSLRGRIAAAHAELEDLRMAVSCFKESEADAHKENSKERL